MISLRGKSCKETRQEGKDEEECQEYTEDDEEKKATTPQGKNKSKLDTTIRFLAIRL